MESLNLILDGLHRIVWTIPDTNAYLSISELWARYHDNFRDADDNFDYDIKDLVVIKADQLEGFEGKNKEEKLNDAVAKTSATFMFAVVAAIYERKKQDILQKYLQR
jgi:hypothetical protein